MKTTGFFAKFLLLVLITMFWNHGLVSGQKVESNTARILINNLPDEKGPPSIRLMTPAITADMTYETEDEELDLIGEARAESGIKFVSVNSDIRNVNDAGVFSSRVKLNPGLNKIRLVVADNEGIVREQYYTIIYRQQAVSLEHRINEESRYFGLIIGTDHYQDPKLPGLDNPIRDAEKLRKTLLENYTFSEGNIILLRNPQRIDIVIALDNLAKKVTPKDNVLIFYAGHGFWDEMANVGYWLPSDAYLSTTANWFRNSTLVDYLKTIHSKHTLLITDACFAGSIFKTRAGFPKPDRAFEKLYDMPSRKAMTSGNFTEVPDRSSFTKYLIERLDNNKETFLSSEQLFSSFRIAVINNSDAIPQYGEIKNVGDEGGDFIFLKKK